MSRSTNILRNTLLFLGIGAWVFLFLALASFHPNDWPSHEAYPWPAAVQNLCGSVGAWCAYYAYLWLGQGAFLIIFFTGVCLALLMFGNRISDLWLRTLGLMLLAVSFAAAVHHFRPGSATSFP